MHFQTKAGIQLISQINKLIVNINNNVKLYRKDSEYVLEKRIKNLRILLSINI